MCCIWNKSSDFLSSSSILHFVGELHNKSILYPSFQVLNKESDQHEKHQVALMSQLQDSRDNVASLEQDKQRLLLQLEDALKKLRDTTREEETLGVELRETQGMLDESDRKREEIKIKAQETVKQWVPSFFSNEQDICGQLTVLGGTSPVCARWVFFRLHSQLHFQKITKFIYTCYFTEFKGISECVCTDRDR